MGVYLWSGGRRKSAHRFARQTRCLMGDGETRRESPPSLMGSQGHRGWHRSCKLIQVMSPRRTSRHYALILIFCLTLSGCGAALPPCASARWVDQVEDEWLVLSTLAGTLQTLAREPDRPHWREGDAILDGRVSETCRQRLSQSIRSIREALID